MQEKITGEDSRLPPWVRYVAAVLIVVATTGVLLLIEPHLPLGQFPIVYVVAIGVVAYLFGEGPAILAFILTAMAFSYFFSPPTGGIWPIANSPLAWAGWAAFALGALLVGAGMTLIRRLTERLRAEVEDHRRAEDELRQSQELLQSIVGNIPVYLVIWDRQLREFRFNEAFRRDMGWTEADTAEGDFMAKVYPDPEYRREAQEYMTSLQPGFRDLKTTAKDGREVDTAWANVHLSGDRYIGIGVNITERKRADEELRSALQYLAEERTRLRTVLDALPVGVGINDAQGRTIELNDAVARIWGGRAPLPKGIEEYAEYKAWWPDTGEPLKPEDWPTARVLRTGEAVYGEVMNIERFDGTRRTILLSEAPLRDAEGRLTGTVGVVEDITELEQLRKDLERALEQAERRRRWIAAILGIAEIGIETMDLRTALDAMVTRIAEILDAHSASIFTLDEDAGEFVAQAEHGVPGLVGLRLKATEGLAGAVWRERKAKAVTDAEHDMLAKDPIVKSQQVKALVAVPLIARGRLMGMARAERKDNRKFTEDEVSLLQAMATRTALIIENMQLVEETRQNFEMLQRALLPPSPPGVCGCRIATIYTPGARGAEIGGDFYDVFETEAGLLAVIIGDVAGKGIPSASLASATRSTLRAFTYDTSAPGESLTHANSVVQSEVRDQTLFVTALAVVADRRTGRVLYANAGHPPAAIYHAQAAEVEFLRFGDPPVGVVEKYRYEQGEAHFDHEDRLVFYTDGLTEARRRNEMFGQEGIERVLKEHEHESPEEIVDALISAACDWAEGRLRDDTAVIVVECERGEG